MLISFKRQIKQEGMDRRVFQHTALGIQALYSMIMCILHAQSPQLHLTLCDLMDYSPPGSSVHGILQAGMLEWVAIPSSKGFSWDRRSSQGSNPHLLHLLHCRHILLPWSHPGQDYHLRSWFPFWAFQTRWVSACPSSFGWRCVQDYTPWSVPNLIGSAMTNDFVAST